jgi:hemin uptake protein HemP
MSTKEDPVLTDVISTPRVIHSAQLFAGKNEVRIVHAGVQYVLRITKENKLILTK